MDVNNPRAQKPNPLAGWSVIDQRYLKLGAKTLSREKYLKLHGGNVGIVIL